MASDILHKLILITGFLSLFHSAYSAAQHRMYLRITEQEFTTLPLDVIIKSLTIQIYRILIQGIGSLFVVMYAILSIAGDFKEIRATVDLESKSWETQRNVPSFYTFNHRGKSLSAHYIPPGSKSALDEVE